LLVLFKKGSVFAGNFKWVKQEHHTRFSLLLIYAFDSAQNLSLSIGVYINVDVKPLSVNIFDLFIQCPLIHWFVIE